MKILLTSVFVILCAQYTNASTSSISVTGICNKKVITDRVMLTFTVEVMKKSRGRSSNEANRLYSKLLKDITAMKLKNFESNTDQYSVNPHYEWIKSKRILKGYRTQISLSVSTSEKKKAGKLIEIGNKAGIQNISGPRQFVSNELYQKEYLSCLKVASSDAKKKADILAKELDVKRGKVYSASDQLKPMRTPSPNRHMRSAKMMESAVADAAPEIRFAKTDIRVQLYVQFLVE